MALCWFHVPSGIEKTLKAYWCACRDDDPPFLHDHGRIAKGCGLYTKMSDCNNRTNQTASRMDTRKTERKIIDPVDFTPDTIQGILPKEFALELVRRYKEAIAPSFDPEMRVMMFGSYAKDCPNEWSDIDVAVIVPKTDKSKWWDTAVSLGRATRDISCYIEPILLENDEDSPIYREVMRTGVAV